MKKFFFTFCAFTLFVALASGQIITTIAGNGIAGNSGDGGAATTAELSAPDGMGIDALGNIYSAEANSSVITMVNTSGIITIVAGNGVAGFSGDNGPATNAELNSPIDVTTDSHGNIYIADRSNNLIRKVNKSGIITTVAGTGLSGFSGTGGPATDAKLNEPGGVWVDSKGNLYIADYMNSAVRIVDTSGIINTIAGTGVAGYNGDGIAAISAQLNYAIGVAVDTSGNVYIADNFNNRIRMVNTSGIIITYAGNGTAGFSGDKGAAILAELNWPTRVFWDVHTGNLYISDWSNGCVRKVTTAGTITTIAGIGFEGYSGDGGPAISAELSHPAGTVVNAAGKVFIDDEANNRIRALSYLESINEITPGEGMKMFPNPVNQVLYVELSESCLPATSVSILDITGKEVASQKMNKSGNTIELNVASLPPGMYLVALQNETKKVIGKFVKN